MRRCAATAAVAAQPARHAAGRGGLSETACRASARGGRCRSGAATVFRDRRTRRPPAAGRGRRAKSCCSPTPSTAISSARISTPRLAVLDAGGYRVHVREAARAASRPLCCGRTFLSVGAVDEARAEAQRTLDGARALSSRAACRWSASSRAACSASATRCRRCCRARRARGSPRSALTFEEFLAREAEAGRLNLPLEPIAERALLHGHCHQKSFGALGAVEQRAQARARAGGRDDRIELLRHGRRLRL